MTRGTCAHKKYCQKGIMYGSLGNESSGSPQKNPCLKPRIVRLNPIGIKATKIMI